MMDKHFYDGAAWMAGIGLFFDWLSGNMVVLQNSVGLLVGATTIVYTVIRIVQALKGQK
jgi:hypothetical protein